jgi:flagellar hook protein FlgE
MYAMSSNSGLPQVGVSGVGGRGSINPGALEMSNVDLAEEFTNMIIAQRGFQANSRSITTADAILNELVNIKR